jgi:fatty-acyl-CoA synthase
MVGYWKRPQLTLSVLNEDGWLRTGDVARLDCDTRELHLLGRIRDVIKTGGELVVSAEVESVLSLHPWVAEVAVLGVASEKYGELVSAVVVLSKQYSVLTKSLPDTRHALTQWCKQRMAGFKVPKMWHFRHEPLPRNSVGKLQKHLLLAPASLIRSFL